MYVSILKGMRSAMHLIISNVKNFRMGKECPRCGEDNMKSPIGNNSISNVDDKTFICSSCGINETRIAFFRAKNQLDRIPKDQLEMSKKFKDMVTKKGIRSK